MEFRNVQARFLAVTDRDRRPFLAVAEEDGEYLL